MNTSLLKYLHLYLFLLLSIAIPTTDTTSSFQVHAEIQHEDIFDIQGIRSIRLGKKSAKRPSIYQFPKMDMTRSGPRITPRIVGGVDAPEGRYPYFVYIEIRTTERAFQCGGTLIWPDIVLTAAHCLIDRVNDGLQVQGLLTWTSLRNISEATTTNPNFRQVVSAIPNPAYVGFNENDNDIMVLRLDSPIDNVDPISLNFDPNGPAVGQVAGIIGLGRLSENGTFADILQAANVNVVAFDDCNDANSYNGNITDALMICAGTPTGTADSCSGDSGGPLILLGPASNQDLQVGISSFGLGCARPNFPGVYTRVSAFQNFVFDNLCNLTSVPPDNCPGATPATPSPTPLVIDTPVTPLPTPAVVVTPSPVTPMPSFTTTGPLITTPQPSFVTTGPLITRPSAVPPSVLNGGGLIIGTPSPVVAPPPPPPQTPSPITPLTPPPLPAPLPPPLTPSPISPIPVISTPVPQPLFPVPVLPSIPLPAIPLFPGGGNIIPVFPPPLPPPPPPPPPLRPVSKPPGRFFLVGGMGGQVFVSAGLMADDIFLASGKGMMMMGSLFRPGKGGTITFGPGGFGGKGKGKGGMMFRPVGGITPVFRPGVQSGNIFIPTFGVVGGGKGMMKGFGKGGMMGMYPMGGIPVYPYKPYAVPNKPYAVPGYYSSGYYYTNPRVVNGGAQYLVNGGYYRSMMKGKWRSRRRFLKTAEETEEQKSIQRLRALRR